MIREIQDNGGGATTAKSRRIKLTVPVVKTRAEMERLVGEISEFKTYETKTKALMDQRITEIRSEYEGQLSEAAQQIDSRMEAARAWAEANPAEFGDKKSIEMTHGVIGFRTGTPKLKTIVGWTWDRVLEKLKGVSSAFIRTKTEVDKEGIIAARETLSESDLRFMGLKVVQEESFFVEPNLTEVEKREVVESKS